MGRPAAPHSTEEVVRNASRLAARFRQLGSTVALVRVAFHPDARDLLRVPTDTPAPFDPSALPADWAELDPRVGPGPGDILVTKRQWGAFYGTELDLQLRRRCVGTIVLGGISTNIGVESTARNAYELGYSQVLVEDAMSSNAAQAHAFAVENIFPRLGRIRSTEDVLAALPM